MSGSSAGRSHAIRRRWQAPVPGTPVSVRRRAFLMPLLLLVATGDAAPVPTAGQDPADTLAVYFSHLYGLCAEGRFAEVLSETRRLQPDVDEILTGRPWLLLQFRQLKEKTALAVTLPLSAQQELVVAQRRTTEGWDCFSQGNPACGEERYAAAIEIVRRYFGEQSVEMAQLLRDLAWGRKKVGDYVRAEAALREVLQICRELLGREDPTVAWYLMQLSVFLEARGLYDEAEQACREALAVHLEHCGEGFIYTTDDLLQLGTIYFREGRFEEAISLMQRALVWRRLLVNQEGRVEECLHDLALVFVARGDYARAEPILRDLLKIRRERYPNGHPSIPANLNVLCQAFRAEGKLDLAEPLAREAVAERRRVHGDVHPDLAKDLALLASILVGRDSAREAEVLYHEALDVGRRSLGPQSVVAARILVQLADLLHEQGRIKEAERRYGDAIRMLRDLGDRETAGLAVALEHLAGCQLAQKKLEEAEASLTEAAAFHEQARSRRGAGMARIETSDSPYRALAVVRLLLGQYEGAWAAAEKDLARSLADLLLATGQRCLDDSDTARLESLQRKLVQLEGRVEVLEREVQPPDSRTSATLAVARDSLLAAEAAWTGFQKDVAFRYPVTEGVAFGLPRIQASLRADVALVGWVEGDASSDERLAWGYVIRNTGPIRWAQLDPNAEPDDGTVRWPATRLFRERLAMAGSWPVRVSASDEIAGAARDLYRIWVEPLERYLDGATRVVVLPSGSMLGVPLEALVTSANAYLGETRAISYAPSATLFAWLWEQGSGRRAPIARKALLVADPDLGSGEDGARWCRPLPAARHEVKELAVLMPGATVLYGRDASEQSLVQLAASSALRGFDTIHLATHALVDDARPEVSALILSQADLPDPLQAAIAGERIYDGMLQAREIVREWHLDADLVTLSACRTAMGKDAGGEGYLGLAQTLLQVGARSLLVSLWQVDDEATSLLMGRFYQNLTGGPRGPTTTPATGPMSKTVALQEAKHWLRTYSDAGGRCPFQHPAYWSAFILIGEP